MTPEEERRVLDAADTMNAMMSGATIGVLLVVGFLVFAVVANWIGG
jgi:hypothetical protein